MGLDKPANSGETCRRISGKSFDSPVPLLVWSSELLAGNGLQDSGWRIRRNKLRLLEVRLQNYDATCRLAQEIAENIHERNRLQRTGSNPAKINMTLRASLQKLKQNIAQLRETLVRASSQRRMYPFTTDTLALMQSEADRRQNLVDDLVTREKQLCSSFSRDGTDPEPSRSNLMSGGMGAGTVAAVCLWLVRTNPEETRTSCDRLGLAIKHQPSISASSRVGTGVCGCVCGDVCGCVCTIFTPPLSVSLSSTVSLTLPAQDAGLDALAAVISRQKRMGEEIGNELDEQN
ncbi:hypothetical protein NFI96_030620, partial [Prochilodus magdalenae]